MPADQGIVLTEARVQVLERKKQDDEARGEIESHHPGYPGSQAPFYLCGHYQGRGPDLLNGRVLSFFAKQQMERIRILTDRGTKYCGKLETHDYQLYLGVNGIEHTCTKARHPQTNGICKRVHKTILHELSRCPPT